MTDFRVAFQAGQEAARAAELARKEIDDVFKVICEQLADVTEGKIEISRQEYEKTQQSSVFPFSASLFAPKKKYWAISARNPKANNDKLREIALWEQGSSGYPCKISWDGMDRTCHDRESLESCLASLLSDPVVGEKLRGVMMLPPPQETSNDALTSPAP